MAKKYLVAVGLFNIIIIYKIKSCVTLQLLLLIQPTQSNSLTNLYDYSVNYIRES